MSFGVSTSVESPPFHPPMPLPVGLHSTSSMKSFSHEANKPIVRQMNEIYRSFFIRFFLKKVRFGNVVLNRAFLSVLLRSCYTLS